MERASCTDELLSVLTRIVKNNIKVHYTIIQKKKKFTI